MVKLVDAMDSKSIGSQPCRFESDRGHQLDIIKQYVCVAFLFEYIGKLRFIEKIVYVEGGRFVNRPYGVCGKNITNS